jgi:hypothetical protein
MIVTDKTALVARVVWIGIDVSKKKLDAAVWRSSSARTYARSPGEGS